MNNEREVILIGPDSSDEELQKAARIIQAHGIYITVKKLREELKSFDKPIDLRQYDLSKLDMKLMEEAYLVKSKYDYSDSYKREQDKLRRRHHGRR